MYITTRRNTACIGSASAIPIAITVLIPKGVGVNAVVVVIAVAVVDGVAWGGKAVVAGIVGVAKAIFVVVIVKGAGGMLVMYWLMSLKSPLLST